MHRNELCGDKVPQLPQVDTYMYVPMAPVMESCGAKTSEGRKFQLHPVGNIAP